MMRRPVVLESKAKSPTFLETYRLRSPSLAAHYLDLVGVLILVLDLDGEVVFINKKGCDILEYADDQHIIGKSWVDNFIPTSLRHQTLDLFRSLADASPGTSHHENSVLTKTGKERIISWHVTHLMNDSGEITAILSSGEDITERRLAEDSLSRVNQTFKIVLDTVADATFFVDPENGSFLDVNEPGCRMFGYNKAEIIGRNIGFLSSGRPPYTQDAAMSTLQNLPSDVPPHFEWECRARDGSLLWVDISIRPLPHGDNTIILASARDVTERKVAAEALRRSMERTIGVIASTVEARDPYTAGHEQRVAELAVAIAREIGLGATEVEGIKFAGMIHDLGKIRIPSEILSKPGKLSKEEYDLLKTHAQAGHDILKDVELPWPVAQIIVQHHERVDGSGYPRGLKTGDIMLEAKIIAIADTVEALVSHRPYRAARDIDVALAELERGTNALYDPKAVDACVKLFKTGTFTFGTPVFVA